MARDYYEVLDVPKDADAKAIKKAYRQLAMKYHPDRNKDDPQAEERFKEATEAYQVLSDDEKRQIYDRFGHDGLKQRGFDPNFTDFGDLGDIFEQLFGGFGFGGFGGGGGRRGRGGGRRLRRGADLELRIDLDFMEAAHGIEKVVPVARAVHCDTCDGKGLKPGAEPKTCATCRGSGQVVQSQGFLQIRTVCPVCRGTGQQIAPEDRCDDCGGSGRKRETSDARISVPAGIESGTRIRYAGKGEAGDPGAPPGDLYVLIQVRPHELFERDGAETYVKVSVPFPTMVLGGEITVPTIHGEEDLDVPAGTASGKVFTLRGKGLADPRGHRGPGDHHVMTVVDVPKKIGEREEELLRELAEIHGDEVKERSLWQKLFGG